MVVYVHAVTMKSDCYQLRNTYFQGLTRFSCSVAGTRLASLATGTARFGHQPLRADERVKHNPEINPAPDAVRPKRGKESWLIVPN
jgi:hypothetical protein